MPTKITSLTAAQKARFPEWSKKWIDIGLSCEPADFEKAEAAALKAYELAGLKRPMVILRMQSPYGGTLAGSIAWYLLKKIKDHVAAHPKDKPLDQAKIFEQARAEISDQVRNHIYNGNSYHGSFWAGWASYVTFLRDVCGWTNPILERFKIEEDLVTSCGWIWWHDNVLVICDRPKMIKRDNEGRLHNETGPSIEYRDGWALYHWHGVVVPTEWITDRKSLTPEIALTWKNVEQRRCACEMLGWDNILSQLKAKVIDKDGDPEIGELVEVELPEIGRERFLRVLCGTKRQFALPVPPNMQTAIEAQAWTWGLDKKTFVKPEVRT